VSEQKLRRARLGRRILLGAMIAFVGLGLAGVLGQRTATVTARSNGYELAVTYGSVVRPGVPIRWNVNVHRDGGFQGPIDVEVSRHYFDLFDTNMGRRELSEMSAFELVLLVVMGDLIQQGVAQQDNSVVGAMLALMDEGCDVVCGSRYMRGGRQIGGPILKGILARLAGLSLHYLAGVPTHDVTNSFKMYRRSLLRRITIESQGGFEIGMEILVKAHLLGCKIGEVPSTWRDRSGGESKFMLWKWLPHYLHWYFLALKGRFATKAGTRLMGA